MNENPHYYAVIPASVRYDPRIPQGAKLLYGEITALSSKEGYCWAGNSYFARLYQRNERTVINWINALRKAGYITVFFTYTAGTKEIERRIIRVADGAASGVVKKSSGGGEKNFTTYGKNLREVVKISSGGGEKNFTDNTTKSITRTTPTTASLKEKPPEAEAPDEKTPEVAAAAQNASQSKKEEELKAAFAEIDEELVFDPKFYGKARAYMDSSCLDTRYLLWLYKQCLKREPKSLAGLYYKLFFAPNLAELFKIKHSSRPPPPGEMISCPVCGSLHDSRDEACPECALARERLSDPWYIETEKQIYAFPPDRKKAFHEEMAALFKRKGSLFTGVKELYAKYGIRRAGAP